MHLKSQPYWRSPLFEIPINLLAVYLNSINGIRVQLQTCLAARNVKNKQKRVLLRILKKQKLTLYGKDHHFSTIKTVENFRDSIPVNEYEDFRALIEQQDKDGSPCLNAKMPKYYAVTSGTTDLPKYIPVSKMTHKYQKKNHHFGLFNLMRFYPKIFFKGKTFAIVSPAVEGHMQKSGIPFGSVSGHLYESIPNIFKAVKYVVPSALFEIKDSKLKQLILIRLALAEKDITYITTANPSTLCVFTERMNQHFEVLLQDIRSGGFFRFNELNPQQQACLKNRLKPNPKRADELELILHKAGKDRIGIKELWPNVYVIGCWTGGSSSIFLDKLKRQLSPKTKIWDIGYLASEVRATIPLCQNLRGGLPSFWSDYFEFVEQDVLERGLKEFLGLHQIKKGQRYYLFVTTASGLYRYNMCDIVEVTGFHKNVPLLQFIQKGKGVTNITGEKLFESQVIQSVREMEKNVGLESSFFLMVADVKQSQYHLLYEALSSFQSALQNQAAKMAEDLDRHLCRINVEYENKRSSGRLKRVDICPLRPGTFERYKKFLVNQGQREEQFKIIALQYETDIPFDFRSAQLLNYQ